MIYLSKIFQVFQAFMLYQGVDVPENGNYLVLCK